MVAGRQMAPPYTTQSLSASSLFVRSSESAFYASFVYTLLTQREREREICVKIDLLVYSFILRLGIAYNIIFANLSPKVLVLLLDIIMFSILNIA